MPNSVTDPRLASILQALRKELSEALGGRLARLVLYGSRARGEARPDSDIDVLIVVKGEVDYAELLKRTSQVVATLSLEHDVVISRTFTSDSQFSGAGTPFLLGVRREGVPV